MTKLKRIGLALYILLFAWYSLIFIGVKNLLPNEKAELFGIEGLLYLFLIIILASYFFKWKYSDLFALVILLAWGYLQYASHWKNLLGFHVDQSDIDWYNKTFSATIHIFPASPTKIIPDAYHIVLDLLLFLNLLLLAGKLLHNLKTRFKPRNSSNSQSNGL